MKNRSKGWESLSFATWSLQADKSVFMTITIISQITVPEHFKMGRLLNPSKAEGPLPCLVIAPCYHRPSPPSLFLPLFLHSALHSLTEHSAFNPIEYENIAKGTTDPGVDCFDQ